MVNNKLVDIAGLGRYHENLKTLLNAKENAGAAADALKAAKEYADSIVDGKFDTAGAAAQALTDAKTYADGLAVNYDATGSADAALAASIFHYGEVSIAELKKELQKRDIKVRL